MASCLVRRDGLAAEGLGGVARAAPHSSLLTHNLPKFFELRRASIWEAEQRWLKERGGKVTSPEVPRTYAQG
jgi:hypothetical protein